MRSNRVLKSVLCFLAATCGPAVLAMGTDVSKPKLKANVAALVRLEDGQAKCVIPSDRAKSDSTSGLPICSNDGLEGQQNLAALRLAQAGGKVQTALLSHLGMFAGGCLIGSLYSVGHALFAPEPEFAGATLVTILSTATAAAGAPVASVFVAGDPTLHVVAAAAGAVVCGGAVSATYLILAGD